MNYLSYHFLKKNSWEDISKSEWAGITAELNQLQKGKGDFPAGISLLGDHYLYEHIVIRKLRAWKSRKSIATISSPNFSRLNTITRLLGYNGYMDFLNNATDQFSFHELKINIPSIPPNTALLDHLTGYWYCYNRNLPLDSGGGQGERVWRSAMEIYKSGGEYLVERTGKDNHLYYGKITSYADFVFMIMNSTTFIRQRHFIGKLRDASNGLKHKDFRIDQMNLVSTCVSFNEEPIALYEIFDRVKHVRDFERCSVDLPLDSSALPPHVLTHLKDIQLNRLTEH